MLARSTRILRVGFVGMEVMVFVPPMMSTLFALFFATCHVVIGTIVRKFYTAPSDGSNQNRWIRDLGRITYHGGCDIASVSVGIGWMPWCKFQVIRSFFVNFACFLHVSWGSSIAPAQHSHSLNDEYYSLFSEKLQKIGQSLGKKNNISSTYPCLRIYY